MRASSYALCRAKLSRAVAWQAVCSRLVPVRSGEAELTEGRDVALLGAPASVKDQHPAGASQKQHGRTRDPLLTPA